MKKDTSWKQVGKWYDNIVSKGGHAYHKEVIFPALEKWLPDVIASKATICHSRTRLPMV